MDDDSTTIAKNLGRIYFNVLQLECAEPTYPKVCLHYTKAFPGSIDPDQPTVPKNRLWFFNQEKSTDVNVRMKGGDRCVEWVENTNDTPTLVFRKPKRLF